MSDDLGTEEEREVHDPAAVRDDIMKRLLDYQRRQREQAAGEAANVSSVWAAPAPARTEQPEATAPPAEEAPAGPREEPAQDAAPSPWQPTAGAEPAADVEARIQALQAGLDRLGSQVGELRGVFQDMAIAADERLSAIETEIARVRAEREEGS